MWYIWLIAAIIFCAAEILYNGFFIIWFAIGSLAALITSFITPNLVIQTIVFLLISFILLITLTKRITQKLSNKDSIATNINGLIGKKGIVIETIGKNNLEPGLVKLDGETWSATSLNDEAIEKGTLVEVSDIKGVRLIVTAI